MTKGFILMNALFQEHLPISNTNYLFIYLFIWFCLIFELEIGNIHPNP